MYFPGLVETASADVLATGVSKERVLIVDDSATVRRVYSQYLSPIWECSEAGSFDEALVKLQEYEFAVVITDVKMPGQSGIELLRKVIENYPPTEVIVASGVDRPQRALDALRVGAFDYLIKPFDMEVLEVTVVRAIARRAMHLNASIYKRQLETRNIELAQQKEQLERLQAQIVHSEKMASLGQLAAGVAHELNNPVGFVHANLEIVDGYIAKLIKYYEGDHPADRVGRVSDSSDTSIDYPLLIEDLNSIIVDCRAGANRIRDIVQNLRTFSRLDEAEYKSTNIHEGIDATVRLLSGYFSSDTITIDREYGDVPLFNGFSSQLNQVWMNLLVNGAQAIGSDPGSVRIKTWHDAENIFVAISDTGAGIAAEDMNRLFDPFFTTKPVGEGTGLGLSISYGIVERHGGSISVDTELGIGTTFTVRLPTDFEPPFDNA
jgi:signal transduction histidine kinase